MGLAKKIKLPGVFLAILKEKFVRFSFMTELAFYNIIDSLLMKRKLVKHKSICLKRESNKFINIIKVKK